MKAFFILTALLLAPLAHADRMPLAYVYDGEGVCDGCAESLAVPLKQAGFKVKYAYPGNFSLKELQNVDLIAVPGGEEELNVKTALLSGEAENIKTYVENGGHYLGVCLGAYLAVDWLTDSNVFDPNAKPVAGLDLFKGQVFNHSKSKVARMEDITWLGKHRSMYFQDGPHFTLAPDANATIWAYYDDQNIAAFQAPLKKGRVGMIGPHAEADRTWWNEDHLIDRDGKDADLLIDFARALILPAN